VAEDDVSQDESPLKRRLTAEVRRIRRRASRVGRAVSDRLSGDDSGSEGQEVPTDDAPNADLLNTNSLNADSPDSEEVRRLLDRIDETYVREHAHAVSEEDVDRVVHASDAIEKRFETGGPLGRLLDDGRLLLSLVQDYRSGRYRDIPRWTLTASAFTLLYVLNPLDLIPDALPVLGVLDDATVVSVALMMLEQDLHTYKEWLTSRPQPVSSDDAAAPKALSVQDDHADRDTD